MTRHHRLDLDPYDAAVDNARTLPERLDAVEERRQAHRRAPSEPGRHRRSWGDWWRSLWG